MQVESELADEVIIIPLSVVGCDYIVPHLLASLLLFSLAFQQLDFVETAAVLWLPGKLVLPSLAVLDETIHTM